MRNPIMTDRYRAPLLHGPRLPAGVVLVVALMTVMTVMVGTPPEDVSARDRDFWNRDATEALREGQSRGRWVLLFFPSPEDKRDPPEIRSFSVPPKMRQELIGARVRAAELETLWERFSMDASDPLPMLLLFNPHGELVNRWNKRWLAQEVLGKFQSGRRNLRRAYKTIDRLLDRSDRAFKLAREAEAIKHLKDARSKLRSGFPQDVRVRDLTKRLRARADDAFLQALALEGLVEDAKLLRDLERLASTYRLEKFVDRVEREKKRVRARTVGGQ